MPVDFLNYSINTALGFAWGADIVLQVWGYRSGVSVFRVEVFNIFPLIEQPPLLLDDNGEFHPRPTKTPERVTLQNLLPTLASEKMIQSPLYPIDPKPVKPPGQAGASHRPPHRPRSHRCLPESEIGDSSGPLGTYRDV